MIASLGSDLVLRSCCLLADFMMARRCVWLSTNRQQNWLQPREFAAQFEMAANLQGELQEQEQVG